MDKVKDFQKLLRKASRIVFFTGAGISTESGIPDYRTPGRGLWENLDAEEYLNIDAFKSNPAKFYELFSSLFDVFKRAEPNGAHKFMAKMQETSRVLSVITQNIDGLHQKAGSTKVRELHGSLMTSRCMTCDNEMNTSKLFRMVASGVNPPLCPLCKGAMKPDVIFFGEMLPPAVMDKAVKESLEADLFVVAGSSLSVMPAAMLPGYAKSADAKVVIINKMPTPYDTMADIVINSMLGEVFDCLEV
jgi:NAD-dependent deacetylase